MNSATNPYRPVLRYHGSKWRLAPWIVSHFPRHRAYVEPFGGGAGTLLRKPRAYAEVYNDLNGDVVNVFRILRDAGQADQLIASLALTPFSRDEYELAHKRTDDPVEAARRFIIVSFFGFSTCNCNLQERSGFRAKSFRSGTSPAWDWTKYPESLFAVINRLRGVSIEHRDAFDLIPAMDRHDVLFYVDPPYPKSVRVRYGAYKHEMTDGDHRRLAGMLHQVKGASIISSYDSSLYRELYSDWRMVATVARTDGTDRTECLWLSPAAERNRGGLFPMETPP
jgi:DNA adenine methylase